MSQKYKTMDTVKKQDLLKKMARQYKSMDFDEKKELLKKKAKEYKTMDAAIKQEVLKRRKQKCVRKNKTVDSCIEEFHKKIKEGP